MPELACNPAGINKLIKLDLRFSCSTLSLNNECQLADFNNVLGGVDWPKYCGCINNGVGTLPGAAAVFAILRNENKILL